MLWAECLFLIAQKVSNLRFQNYGRVSKVVSRKIVTSSTVSAIRLPELEDHPCRTFLPGNYGSAFAYHALENIE